MSSLGGQLGSISHNKQAISFRTPVGEMHAISDFNSIKGTGWGAISDSEKCEYIEVLEWVKNWFDGYFMGEIIETPPIDKDGLSEFASDVITTLLEQVPYGNTVSYDELGILSGYQNSSRAVGGVMSKNPWPILVPCHRVISSNGDVGNYSRKGGSRTKLRLIKMEAEHEVHNW